MNNNKYKTVLCKHFGQTGTCSYGDKCQFAHGYQELKNPIGGMPPMSTNSSVSTDTSKVKNVPNPNNFKIVKCKNWETTGTCSYGSVCTFAHGDQELRTKVDNTQVMSNSMFDNSMGMSMQDPNMMYNMMIQQQMMMMNMGGMGGQPQNMDFQMTPEMLSYYQQFGGFQPQMNTEVNLNDNNNAFPGMNMGNFNYQDYMNMNMQGNNSSNNNMYTGGKP